MLVRAHSFAVDRGAAVHADVELDLRAGLPGLAVIGLGAGPARDLRERVQAAVLNSGFAVPRRRLTVNIAPPLARGGAEHDLAVACCALAASGEIDPERLLRIGLCGELALGGELRASGAGTAIADAAASEGLAGLLTALADREQALAANVLPVATAGTLAEVVRLLCRHGPRTPEHSARPRTRQLSRTRRPR
ncbi:MAG: magnesium chelatase domain-containing protein [Solirubrobacteraceae bacterium]|jgi:magnesium chelatase family protein